ncbi:Cas10/Cmr2 second palm domain-containing protein [Desulfonatronovibrio magnus]|uniref:Cas10/Cmr2 second palm domain-containing protein n=1 Tax=Desulfonatronovibrio magnus TaxID=698827 RepID=UPI0005EB75A1|nr:hypothetical protein [Desulfonatronovibrio magnus]
MIITIFDALGIQEYLFGSNKLAENIGGSYLVDQAMKVWLPQQADHLGISKSKLVYNAGGNAVFQLDDMEKEAKPLAVKFSKVLLEKSPGLNIACYHYRNNPGTPLNVALQEAFAGLRKVKSQRTYGLHKLLGFGVTQLCETGTQEPAVRYYSSGADNRFLGPSALAKVSERYKADGYLKEQYDSIVSDNYDFPTELDDLGRSTGEKSYVGVVHIDGNSIGGKLQDILNRKGADEDLIQEIKHFSAKVQDAGTQALQNVVSFLMDNIEGNKCAQSFELKEKSGKILLPFRPLVFGGDDITFVCDGRIAFDLAHACVKKFHERSGFHACAGIALCKNHYPFYRAYSLAEQLCVNAKEYVRNKGKECSALDWHVLSGGPERSIRDVRKEQYVKKLSTGEIHLTCRPYQMLPENEDTINDWFQFRNNLLDPLQNKEPWLNAHSRLKGLTAYLCAGPEASKIVLEDWKAKKYVLPGTHGGLLPGDAYSGKKTPYLDALELLDFMVFLNS